ncbi:MAG: methyl-accepting chemotaxis protein [Solidesulfovibrio sp. DCME]|uniref:methyl-accepting chemotaxis protein n=1 Tax=Solidesulfovibrio sp. DCME TaxID=3447380 RepID=UPI003D0D8F9B
MRQPSLRFVLTASVVLPVLVGLVALFGYASHGASSLVTRLAQQPADAASLGEALLHQRLWLAALGLCTLGLAGGAAWLAARAWVTRPLDRMRAYAARVAGGDFKASLDGVFRGEAQALAVELRRLVGECKTRLGFAEGVLVGIPTPYGIVSADGTISWTNAELYGLLEKKESWEAYVGQNAGQYYWNDAKRETLLDAALRQRKAQSAEFDYTSPSGKAKRIAERATPFYDFDGTLIGAISFWADLTQLHRQQERITRQNEAISRTAAQATDVSNGIAQAATELSAQIEQANQGAQEQNDRVQATAAAMEEINATILEVAKNASAAAQSADDAGGKARQGAQLAGEVTAAVAAVRDEADILTATMRSLDDQARGIGAIMDVISGIADQTNLLALNAAIEAARAGDAGRGFAVVADEVRKLAETTMQATKEVEQTISGVHKGMTDAAGHVEQAVARVGQATALAGRSGEALLAIVAMVEAASDQVRAIATAAEEQSATSEEINRAVEKISAIAAQTAQGMRQSATAVSRLAGQAKELDTLMAGLHTDAAA